MARIYLDTSFFIGLLENQDNRQEEAGRILAYEQSNDRFTSELTLNEFMIRVYDGHKHDDKCEELLDAVEVNIRSIARVVAFAERIPRMAALLQSMFGEIHKHTAPPKEPRDRKFRWDAIHLATAQAWNCERIYAWDGKWETLPQEIKNAVGGTIIAPARCLGLPLEAPQPPPIEETNQGNLPSAPEVPADAAPVPSSPPIAVVATGAAATEPPPPSEPPPAAAPVSDSPPEPSRP